MSQDPPTDTPQPSLRDELLALWARQGRRLPVPNLVASVIFVCLAWQSAPHLWLGCWLGLVAAIQSLRWLVMGNWDAYTSRSPDARLRIAIAINLATGTSFGLSVMFFPWLSDAVQALQSMVLAGLAAGSAITAGWGLVFAAFAVPVLAPLILFWAFDGAFDGQTWIPPMVALLIAMYAATITVFSRDMLRLFRSSYESRREQQRLNSQLTVALAREEAASRAKTRFLASASHDLRQPLHTVSLFAAALTMRELDGRSREIADSINEALQDLAAELDALLDVSKLDAGVVRANVEQVDLHRLLMRLRDSYEPVARAKGLSVLARCPQGAWVNTDRQLMERVLHNLIDNAVKYTDTGWVNIEAVVFDQTVELTIRDTGCGIPEDERQRVFEEFYQIDNAERDRHKGLGLGLSIVKRLVDLMGIRMTLSSEPGHGTRFQLQLSGGQAPAGQVPELPAAPIVADKLPPAGVLHVLVVDDEASVRRAMQSLLEAMGCRVTLARGTEQALAEMSAASFDLALVDYRLRDGDDGIHLVQALRRLHPGLPAVLISGDTAPQRLRDADAAQIQLLHKPVHADAIARVISEVTEGSSKHEHGRTANPGRPAGH